MTIRWRGVLRRHSRALGFLFAAYWLAMFVATHIKLPQVESAPQHADKVVHLLMYAGFAFLLALWRSTRNAWSRTLAWRIFGVAAIYAALDEILQIPLESRSAEVWDFVMDLIGAILGLVIFWAFRARFSWFWETAPPHG